MKMNIIPGEPVPPGFEDEVNRVAEIQSTLKNYQENALIGLEYTVELINDEDREPSYVCILCEKRGDPRTIINHWTSYNHRLKYLEKHFPSALRELAPVRYKPDSRQAMNHLITEICKAIEQHYGRLSVGVYHADDYRSARERIVDEIMEKYHYDEKSGPTFTNAIDRDFLNKNTQILQITIKTPASINADAGVGNKDPDSLDEVSSDEEFQRKVTTPSSIKGKKRKSQSPAFKVTPRVHRSPPFEEARTNDLKKKENTNITLPSPKELSMQAFQIAQERYKWEKYRCMLEIAVKGLEKSLKDYEKNPEKHPLYPEEWKKFWNRRYKELQAEKKVDPNKYDYKPEWIVFWTKRMKELHTEEVEQKKKQIKINLGLKEDAEEKTDQLKQKYKVQSIPHRSSSNDNSTMPGSNPSAPSMKKDVSHSSKVINISDDDDDDIKSRNSRVRSKRTRVRSKSRSLSPLSDDYREPDRRHPMSYRNLYERGRAIPRSSHYPSSRGLGPDYYASYHGSVFPPPPTYGPGYRVMDPYMYPQYEKKIRFSPPPKGKSKIEEPKEEVEDEGPLTVVAVLRLLTALEEHLGSLGPKVVDLLGKALALEKVKANSSDDMLVNEDNSVFFETIKEKLKGLLIADVLDDTQKVRAVKKAVKNIAAIIHQVNEKGKSSESVDHETNDEVKPAEEKSKKPKSKPTIADLPFDRQIVSTKLAAALVMQGREDVSTTDMDKLIYFFILLVKISKEKVKEGGKPIQMKNILPELGIAPQLSPTLVEEIIEQEVATLAAEVEMEMEVDAAEKETNISSGANALESLTDSDLQTLLQNFKHLSTEEQHHLIAHLKKLETADPARVEKLRKYVNLETESKETPKSVSANSEHKFSDSSRSKKSVEDSPPPRRRDHYTDDEESRGSNARKFIDDDDEDDDYNFEDVFKAASSNIKRTSDDRNKNAPTKSRTISPGPSRQQSNTRQVSIEKSPTPPPPPGKQVDMSTSDFKKALSGVSIADTQNLIANLMGSLQQSCGKFGNSKPDESSSQTPRNTQQNLQPPGSVPFYQQQQQQQMYPAYPNQQMPVQDNYYQGGYNQVAYPNFNYVGPMQPAMNAPQLAPFNANYMQQHTPDQANYNWNTGNGGYK